MFTGIVTEVGRVARVDPHGDSVVIDIACNYPALVLGESIAVDGVCLTVATVLDGAFRATMSAETVTRSTLGNVRAGAPVNLERALAVGDRLGGHMVSGHVDGVGRVKQRTPVTDAERWTFEVPEALRMFVATKGSITIDGVSLTVNHVGPTTLDVMLVPFTLTHTALRAKQAGDAVNLEVDVIARYVARLLEVRGAGHGAGVSMEALVRAGLAKDGDGR